MYAKPEKRMMGSIAKPEEGYAEFWWEMMGVTMGHIQDSKPDGKSYTSGMEWLGRRHLKPSHELIGGESHTTPEKKDIQCHLNPNNDVGT